MDRQKIINNFHRGLISRSAALGLAFKNILPQKNQKNKKTNNPKKGTRHYLSVQTT